MSSWLKELKNSLESLKNRSPEKFLLLFSLLGLVIFLWGYIILFLPQETTLSSTKDKRYKMADTEKEDFNFANDDINDKIDSKDSNKEELDRIDDKQLRNSPFEYQNNFDSDIEDVFSYQLNPNIEESKIEKENLNLDKFSLKGIILTENNKLAVIESDNKNNYYRNLDDLAGYIIDKISLESVTLKDEFAYKHRLEFED